MYGDPVVHDSTLRRMRGRRTCVKAIWLPLNLLAALPQVTAPGIDLTKTRSEEMGEADEKALKELFSFIIEAVIIPVLAVFGIAGNFLITH